MQSISIQYSGCVASAVRADGATMDSACGAGGDAFTAGELLATSLGSCIAASLAPLVARHGLNESALKIVLAGKSREISAGFDVHISMPACPVQLLQRFKRAAAACPVKRALNIPIEFHWLVS